MRITRNKIKLVGKTKVPIEDIDKEFIAVDEGIGGLDFTAICYDRSKFFEFPEFKEFGINFRLTPKEVIQLDELIQVWKQRLNEYYKHQIKS